MNNGVAALTAGTPVLNQRRSILGKEFRPPTPTIPALTTEEQSTARFLRRLVNLVRFRSVFLSLLTGGFVYVVLRTLFPRNPKRPLPTITEYINENSDCYDVIVIGAGPAGSTAAYYLAKAGKKVLVLERHRPTADKVCGDCIPPAAQRHLHEMGVMHEIQAELKGRWSKTGGFVSPTGNSFISEFSFDREICVQRIVLDEKIARAAERAGAKVLYRYEVTKLQLRKQIGIWNVTCIAGDQNEEVSLRSRFVVAADGAASRIARLLSVVTTPPNAAAARSFVRAGTHSFKADKVVFYPKTVLPGFTVVFHELEDYLCVTTFVTPGCSTRLEQTAELHNRLLENDPFIREALGPNAVHTATMVADLRVGGVERSFDAHFLCVGDAAGHVDPMTGQGIQFGMEGAKIAAERIVAAFAANDFSARFLASYQRRWMRAFGYSFAMTKWMISLVKSCPVILDAAANIIRGNGEEFTTAWNLALSGYVSKLWFLRPDVGWFILAEALRLWFLRYFKLSPEYFAPRYRLQSLLRAAVRGDDDI